MSTVVIIAVGSRGDVAPLTGVGVGLRRAGHDVVIAAFSPFADLITQCGLRFRELSAALDRTAESELAKEQPMKGLAAFVAPAGMRKLGNDIVAALADEPADILLLSPFAEMAGHPLAESRDIPSIGVRLQPLSATAQYPPAVLGAWSLGAVGNRLAAQGGSWLMDRFYGGVVAGLRRDLRLPKASTRRLRRQRSQSHWPVLHGYSPIVAARPKDWRPGLEITGYWWPAATSDWAPPPALTNFLAGGPEPVFVGFGSTMASPERAQQLSDTIADAARQAGVRAIVQTGWSGLNLEHDDNLLTIGEVPHDWLFPRVVAVAHHCGAGTAAAGLRAGVPVIGLPGYGDGPFWARRLHDLGVSAATIPQRALTADRLAQAFRTAVTEPGLRVAAARLSERIAAEDGCAQAVSTVELLLHQSA